MVRVDWHPRPHGVPTSITSSTLNGHLLRQAGGGHLFPTSQMTKWRRTWLSQVTQIWGSRTAALRGCHLEFPTVDGRVLSPCWPHEKARGSCSENLCNFSNNKPVLIISQSHSQRSLTNLFPGACHRLLSNQVLKPVGGHHNQLPKP